GNVPPIRRAAGWATAAVATSGASSSSARTSAPVRRGRIVRAGIRESKAMARSMVRTGARACQTSRRRYHRDMRAAVLAVGSELLSTDRLDTNSLRLAALLERHDCELVGKAVAADDE